MVKISPQQAIFLAVATTCESLGYDTYDYLPMEEVAYPFVFVGEDSSTDLPNKTAIHGSYRLTLHVYNRYRKRGTTTEMIMNIKGALRELKQVQGFFVSVVNVNDQMLIDNTTNTPLLHGVLDIEFYFN